MKGLIVALGLVIARGSSAQAALQWVPAPPVFRRGAQIAVVNGNPGMPGRFTAELSLPDGYVWPPHVHVADEFIEVMSGALLVGMGDHVDRAATRPMATGDTATTAAGMHHYAIARGATVIAITINGPYVITYIHASDEPQRSASFPF
jgi:hypothetical protein